MFLPLSMGLVTTPFSIAFRAFILGISFLLIFRNLSIPKARLHYGYAALLIFWTIYIVRLVYDLSIRQIDLGSQLGSANHLYLFAIGSTFIPLIAIAGLNGLFSAKSISKNILWFSFIQCIAISIIYFVLYGVSVEAFYSRHMISQLLKKADLGNPINPIIISRAGGYLALISLLYKSSGKFFTFARVGLFIFGLGLLSLGASRGPLVAFLVCIISIGLYYLYYEKKNLRWAKNVFLVILSFISLLFIYNSFEGINLSIIERVVNMTEGGYKGDARVMVWQTAWDQFVSSPIVGDKIIEDLEHSYPHNLILEVLMSVGLIGFIPFIIAIYYTFKRAFRLMQKGYKMFFYIFLFGFVSMLFSGAIFLLPGFWASLALVYIIRIPDE
jgi:hypothetical protein